MDDGLFGNNEVNENINNEPKAAIESPDPEVDDAEVDLHFKLHLSIRNNYISLIIIHSQPAITCSKLTIETLEQGVKYVQS